MKRSAASALLAMLVLLGQEIEARGADSGAPLQENNLVQGLVTVLGVTLNTTTLSAVTKTLGAARMRKNGLDASNGATNLCYRGRDGTVLVFSSSSEMGPNHELTSYELVDHIGRASWGAENLEYRTAVAVPRCALSTKVSRKLAVGAGLRMGMRVEDVEKRLGRPTETSGGLRRYEYQYASPPSPDRTTNVIVEIVFAGEEAVSISVSSILSD